MIDLFEPAIALESESRAYWVISEIRTDAPHSALIKMVDRVEQAKPEEGEVDPFNPFGRRPGVRSPFGEPADPFGFADQTPNSNSKSKVFRQKFNALRKQRM